MIGSIFAIKALILSKTTSIYFAAGCQSGNFFGFPPWYKYLGKNDVNVDLAGGNVCSPRLDSLNDFWLIGLAVVEILLRVAILAAIAYVLLSGVKYVTSRGNTDKTEAAKKTLVDALIGLIIAISATAVVTFIAGRFT